MTGLYTVCLFVKQLNKNKNTFRLMSNLPLAPPFRKRLLQISKISMRNINNHVKVEKKTTRHVTTRDGSGKTFKSCIARATYRLFTNL